MRTLLPLYLICAAALWVLVSDPPRAADSGTVSVLGDGTPIPPPPPPPPGPKHQ